MMMPYSEYRDTPLWKALQDVLAELQATREISVGTAPEYVIDYCCRELVAKHVVREEALTPPPAP